jgi:GNAT superfamily N-acetyltransferase
MKRKYTMIAADEDHRPIETLRDLSKTKWRNSIGFFLPGPDGRLKKCGHAALCILDQKKKWVHTESMWLERGMRHKGHGIHMYLHTIQLAKQIGAERIFSSKRLNKHSERMWGKKLDKYFTVVHMSSRHQCNCKFCRKKFTRHYIDLRGLNAKTMPR